MSKQKVEEGIALYTIELNGCLNGVYTNEGAEGVISNEIAIKKVKDDKLDGEYDCLYFENGKGKKSNEKYDVALKITQKGTQNVYEFAWIDAINPKNSFKGIGYKMNDRQIAVRYESVK